MPPSRRIRASDWRTLLSGRLELNDGVAVKCVERCEKGYRVHGAKGESWITPTPPILATGFRSSLTLIEQLFDKREDGHLRLGEADESTRTPGPFVVGPNVRHGQQSLCFIYKFRQRFAVIARKIGGHLGFDTSTFVKLYREDGMFLADLSCCDQECTC